MNLFNFEFYLLIMAILLIFSMTIYLSRQKKRNQLHKFFMLDLICLLIISIGISVQAILSTFVSVSPLVLENFIYIGTCFFPVFFLLTSLVFINTKLVMNRKYLLLFIIPSISLFLLWTNSLHHLFFIYYPDNLLDTLSKTVYGSYFIIHTLYSYLCIVTGMITLIFYSVKNSGFFSKQSLLICSGTFISLIINILATLGILDLSIYVTPISFTIAVFFIALAIFKFDFLKVTPIALQKVVDRISDAYVIVNENNTVTDFNQTFLDLFHVASTDIRNKSIDSLLEKYKEFGIKSQLILSSIEKARTDSNTIVLEEPLQSINKIFHIEINNITSKGNFLGTLILLKDITQHITDMKAIKDNQDMLVEKERLASLGQMIGGIAHNLKTPIMSIAGAAEGLSDLIKEYDEGIEDPDLTPQDHHEIAGDMRQWIGKIRTHLSYMSDVITAIKGQAVAFSDQTSTSFTIKELINYIDILMKHELKNALINLNTQADIDITTKVNGNINSLVQVINNIISNSIQAYQSKEITNQDINFNIYSEDGKIVFKIQDFAGGLPENVQEKLFKEMVTTKGKNGTGLGLFMSYSNIKAHFNGNLRYETEQGKGTSFFIEIPLL